MKPSGYSSMSSSTASGRQGLTPVDTTIFSSSQSNSQFDWGVPPMVTLPSISSTTLAPWETLSGGSSVQNPSMSFASPAPWETLSGGSSVQNPSSSSSNMPWMNPSSTPSVQNQSSGSSNMPWETYSPVSSTQNPSSSSGSSNMPWETYSPVSSTQNPSSSSSVTQTMPWETYSPVSSTQNPSSSSSDMPWMNPSSTPSTSSSTPQVHPSSNLPWETTTQSSMPNLYQTGSSSSSTDFDSLMANMGINMSTPNRVVIPKPEESITSVGAFSTRAQPGFLQTTRKSKVQKYNVPLSNSIPDTMTIPPYLSYTPAGALPQDISVPTVRYEEVAQRKANRPEALKDIIQSNHQKGIEVNQQSLRIELLNRKKPVVTGNVDLTSAYVSSYRTKSLAELDDATIKSIIDGSNKSLHIPDLKELIRRQGYIPIDGKRKDLLNQLRQIYRDVGIGSSIVA